MAQADKIRTLVNQLPAPDKSGTYVHLDEAMIKQIEKVTAELAAGGKSAAEALVDMQLAPGAGDDIKARYALHRLAVHHSGGKDDKARSEFCQVLAGHLAGDKPAGVKQYLIQELQVCGRTECVSAVGACLLDEELCDWAGRTLASIGRGQAAAAGVREQFLAALPKAKALGAPNGGKARLVILNKLAVLQDVQAGDALKQALGDSQAEARVAAGWALARMADPSAAGPLLQAADKAAGYERNHLTDACLTLAENLLQAGKKSQAAGILDHVRKTRTDKSEAHFATAAERAMAQAKLPAVPS